MVLPIMHINKQIEMLSQVGCSGSSETQPRTRENGERRGGGREEGARKNDPAQLGSNKLFPPVNLSPHSPVLR